CVCLSFFSSSIPLLPLSLLFPYTTLFRSPGLAGWFSSDKNKQFDMEHELTPAPDACAFQIGTPNMLSAAPLLGALELFQEAGIRSEEHTSELHSRFDLVCRLLLEKKKKIN